MSDIKWRNDVTPVSSRFDDPYYSVDDGRAETDYVFIKGNDLQNRWPHMQSCIIAELGFGTGLNFLETIYQWNTLKPQNAKLQFISFEQFPMQRHELEKALSNWPELQRHAKKLIEIWQPNADTCKCSFSDNIELIIHMKDANQSLKALNLKADAWYLDGFAPAKNPELWNEALMHHVGSKTAEDGTFATYTAAGFVKRGLEAAGFNVIKTKGFGRKRDMLTGKKST